MIVMSETIGPNFWRGMYIMHIEHPAQMLHTNKH